MDQQDMVQQANKTHRKKALTRIRKGLGCIGHFAWQKNLDLVVGLVERDLVAG